MMKKQLPKEKHSLKDDLEEDLKARLLQMKSELKEEDEKKQTGSRL